MQRSMCSTFIVTGSSHGRALALPGPLILIAQAAPSGVVYGTTDRGVKARPSYRLVPESPILRTGDTESRGAHINRGLSVPWRTADPGCPRPSATSSSVYPASRPP
jgi:hypothetical protein